MRGKICKNKKISSGNTDFDSKNGTAVQELDCIDQGFDRTGFLNLMVWFNRTDILFSINQIEPKRQIFPRS